MNATVKLYKLLNLQVLFAEASEISNNSTNTFLRHMDLNAYILLKILSTASKFKCHIKDRFHTIMLKATVNRKRIKKCTLNLFSNK